MLHTPRWLHPERLVALIWFETPDLKHAHNSRPRQSQRNPRGFFHPMPPSRHATSHLDVLFITTNQAESNFQDLLLNLGTANHRQTANPSTNG